MPTAIIADRSVDVDAEGFLLHTNQWDEAVATEIAREYGINPLTERHWSVIHYMRERYLDTGSAPTIRSLGKESGVAIKELYQLFDGNAGFLA